MKINKSPKKILSIVCTFILSVTAYANEVKIDTLEKLKQLHSKEPNKEILVWRSSGISDEILKQVASFSKLKTFHTCECNKVDSKRLKLLQNLPIEDLKLQAMYTDFDENSVTVLQKYKQLKILRFGFRATMNDESLKLLSKLKQLEALVIGHALEKTKIAK